MVWLPYGEKNFEDIFIRFGTTHERDRRTDRQTPHADNSRAMHSIARQKPIAIRPNSLMDTLKPHSNGPLYTRWWVHWPLLGRLLHLVQRGGSWAGCGPAQSPPRCTKCNSPPINGQCNNFILFDVPVKGLNSVQIVNGTWHICVTSECNCGTSIGWVCSAKIHVKPHGASRLLWLLRLINTYLRRVD